VHRDAHQLPDAAPETRTTRHFGAPISGPSALASDLVPSTRTRNDGPVTEPSEPQVCIPIDDAVLLQDLTLMILVHLLEPVSGAWVPLPNERLDGTDLASEDSEWTRGLIERLRRHEELLGGSSRGQLAAGVEQLHMRLRAAVQSEDFEAPDPDQRGSSHTFGFDTEAAALACVEEMSRAEGTDLESKVSIQEQGQWTLTFSGPEMIPDATGELVTSR
jgi:hypothetical protein